MTEIAVEVSAEVQMNMAEHLRGAWSPNQYKKGELLYGEVRQLILRSITKFLDRLKRKQAQPPRMADSIRSSRLAHVQEAERVQRKLRGSEGSDDSDLLPYAEHGPGIDHNVPETGPGPKGAHLFWSRVRHFCRDPFSEFFGTFVLILFGDGSVAQVVLSKGKNGDWLSICWGWG